MSKSGEIAKQAPATSGSQLPELRDNEIICSYVKGGAIWKKKSGPRGNSYVGFVPLYPRLERSASGEAGEEQDGVGTDEEGAGGVLSECVVC